MGVVVWAGEVFVHEPSPQKFDPPVSKNLNPSKAKSKCRKKMKVEVFS